MVLCPCLWTPIALQGIDLYSRNDSVMMAAMELHAQLLTSFPDNLPPGWADVEALPRPPLGPDGQLLMWEFSIGQQAWWAREDRKGGRWLFPLQDGTTKYLVGGGEFLPAGWEVRGGIHWGVGTACCGVLQGRERDLSLKGLISCPGVVVYEYTSVAPTLCTLGYLLEICLVAAPSAFDGALVLAYWLGGEAGETLVGVGWGNQLVNSNPTPLSVRCLGWSEHRANALRMRWDAFWGECRLGLVPAKGMTAGLAIQFEICR
jgi:hypothetical protein